MSVQELEQQIEQLKPEEQARLESFIRTLRKVNSPGFKEKIAQSHAEFDAGDKITSAKLQDLVEGRAKR